MSTQSAVLTRQRLRQPRPTGLEIVAAVQGLFGALGLVGGLGALAAPTLPAPTGLGLLQVFAPNFPLLMIGLGVLLMALSVGLWQGRTWAWLGTILVEVVHIVVDIGFVFDRSFALDKALGLIVIVGVLLYLSRPDVRTYFGVRH
jgi:hypothetical protein